MTLSLEAHSDNISHTVVCGHEIYIRYAHFHTIWIVGFDIIWSDEMSVSLVRSMGLAAGVILVLQMLPVGGAAAQDAVVKPDRRGAILFLQCRACHTLKAGEPNRVGPNLAGVIGRKAGGATDFAYSPALLKSGIVWTDKELDLWLLDPMRLVKGTKMAYSGMKQPEDRAALIAYLKSATK